MGSSASWGLSDFFMEYLPEHFKRVEQLSSHTTASSRALIVDKCRDKIVLQG